MSYWHTTKRELQERELRKRNKDGAMQETNSEQTTQRHSNGKGENESLEVEHAEMEVTSPINLTTSEISHDLNTIQNTEQLITVTERGSQCKRKSR